MKRRLFSITLAASAVAMSLPAAAQTTWASARLNMAR